MVDKFIFLSYQRSRTTTPAMEQLYRRAGVVLAADGVETFFDRRSLEAGDAWLPSIDAFLAKCTHFLAFVSIDYWLSAQCRRELDIAVSRYELTGAPQLLFVLADSLAPGDLLLNPPGADAVEPLRRRVRSLGQINFLGPHDEAGRLVRLAFESPHLLADQLAELVEALQRPWRETRVR